MEEALCVSLLVALAMLAGWLLHGARWDLRELWLLSCAADGEPVLLGGEPYRLVKVCSAGEGTADAAPESAPDAMSGQVVTELEEAATEFLQPPPQRPRKRFRAEGW